MSGKGGNSDKGVESNSSESSGRKTRSKNVRVEGASTAQEGDKPGQQELGEGVVSDRDRDSLPGGKDEIDDQPSSRVKKSAKKKRKKHSSKDKEEGEVADSESSSSSSEHGSSSEASGNTSRSKKGSHKKRNKKRSKREPDSEVEERAGKLSDDEVISVDSTTSIDQVRGHTARSFWPSLERFVIQRSSTCAN